jgi:hypothetical protein
MPGLGDKLKQFGYRSNRAKPSPQVMTASGRVIDLRNRDSVASLAMTRMAWQSVAWNYRNSIGELGQALRMKGNVLSKLGWGAAYQPPGENDPVLLTGDPEQDKDEDGTPYLAQHVIDAAIDCVNALPWERGYAWTGRIVTGFDVPGEVWLHGETSPLGVETWNVRSSSEVIPSGGGGLAVIDVPGHSAREVDPDTETLIRLWVPHPEWGDLADSPLRTMLDVCEDVVLAGREIRAAAMSRIASNGLLFIPEGMTLVRPGEEDVTVQNSGFAAGLAAAMTAPISDEGHPAAIVPITVYGDPEDGASIRHIPLERRPDADVINRLKVGLDRIADSIDLPREAMRGTLGEANHWSAWLVDAQTFENHLEPGARLVADSVTESYFRRRLMLSTAEGGYGLTEDEAKSVRVWFDPSTITRNTNRSADADAALDRGAIGYPAYRRAKGFDEGDAPTKDDLQQLITVKSAAPQDAMGQLLQTVAGIRQIEQQQPPMVVPGQIVRPGQQQLPPGQEPPPAGPGQAPANGTPPTPPGARTASAGDRLDVLDSVRVIDGQALADIDRELIEAIRHAAEAELASALRKAGSKIKAQVQGKDAALAERLKGQTPELVGSMVGYDRLQELGLTEDILLAAAFAYLASKFSSWTGAAIKNAVIAASEMLAFPLVTTQALASAMSERIPAAWKKLESSLRARAMSALYGRKGDTLPDGEVPDTIILPGDIREALAEIGGPASQGPGGLALGGDILREIDQRAVGLGFTWRYGVTPRARAFHPHRELAGERFESYTDPRLVPAPAYAWIGPHMHPGDHPGCMCDFVPAWAVQEADTLAQAVIDPDTPGMHNERVLAELDDRAGRVGTHSQRTRDERDRMVEVQRAWIERRAPR